MGRNHPAPKRPVNLLLNDDLVRRAQRITPNLSQTIEALLAAHVAQAEARDNCRDQLVSDYITASDAFAAEHGSLADEFPTL